jgi:hypothetical protein
MTCRHCGGPKPPGQGRKYCSDACQKLGPATFRECQECGTSALVPDQIKPKGKLCAECLKAHARATSKRHYEANREQVKANVKAYVAANREQIKASKADHYQRNREKIRAQQSEYARTHKEKNAARSHAWYMTHRDLQRARSAAWRDDNLERRREQVRVWYRKLRKDPARYQRRLENARIADRLRAERAGRPMKPMSEVAYVKRYGPGWKRKERVPAAPIARLLHDLEDVAAFTESVDGLSASFISRVSAGRITDLSVRDADVLCVALGLTLSLVYPEQLAQTG